MSGLRYRPIRCLYTPGSVALTYTITVTNAGPDTATDAVVRRISGALYRARRGPAVASAAPSCAASGNGSISETATFPRRVQWLFTVDGTVVLGAVAC
jgi:hypothetical protein